MKKTEIERIRKRRQRYFVRYLRIFEGFCCGVDNYDYDENYYDYEIFSLYVFRAFCLRFFDFFLGYIEL
jgi:hypothetical protein